MKVLWLLKTQSKFLLPLCLVLVMIYNPRFGKAVQLTALILLSASFVLIKFKKDSIRERISEFLKPEKEDIESSFEKNKQVNYDFKRSGSMVHTGNNKVRKKEIRSLWTAHYMKILVGRSDKTKPIKNR